MIPRVVLTIITILASFGHHKGVQCFNREIIEAYNNDRNFDVSNFLNFNIDQFDLYNRQCFLAFLVYTKKYLFKSTESYYQYNNIADMFTFITRSIRILNIEFISKFGDEISIMYELMRDWDTSRFDLKKKSAAQNQAILLIKLGIKKYVWNTEKEAEILKEYKIYDSTTFSTRKTYSQCTLSYRFLAASSKKIEKLLQKEFSNSGWSYMQWGYNFEPSELKDFGTVLFFVTYDDFKKFPVEKSTVPRNYQIVEYLKSILIDILKNMRYTISDELNISFQSVLAPEKVPRETNIDLELLTILKHLYRKIIDTAQDLYLLLRSDELYDNDLKEEYKKFDTFFQYGWNFMNSENSQTPVKKNQEPVKTTKPASEKAEAPDFINAMVKKLVNKDNSIFGVLETAVEKSKPAKSSGFFDGITAAVGQSILNSFLNEKEPDIMSGVVKEVGTAILPDIFNIKSTSDKAKPTTEKTIPNESFENRKINPPSIKFYSVLNDSCKDNIPSESTINKKKIILHEINIMLTIVQHNLYTLTAAERNLNKDRLAWDCGYINGCKAPSSGTLGFDLKLRKIPVSKSIKLDFMPEFQKSRAYIQPYFEKPVIKRWSDQRVKRSLE